MEYRLSGRITSNDAQKTEEELLELLPDVIDAAQLSYISSAGLRALLKLSQNKTDRVVIKNVRPDVYDIFESTGFTEIFSIEKQLREVSAKGCKLIGKGYCASVYRLDGERVIKVYDAPRHSGDLSAVQREYEISKKVFLSGLPSIIGFEVVVCDGYYAGIYELVDGDTMGNTIYAFP
ncbi:MAG: STAS domain-containing protein [Lachnospiraceae bacterium]|nr:STAS domain-containing protein [Lachnospiraceae bacterium]